MKEYQSFLSSLDLQMVCSNVRLQIYIDHADLASVGGYISAFKINKFLELVTMFCSEGMQYDLMLHFLVG